MSTGSDYSSLPDMINAQQMSGDIASGVVSTEWYAPSSVCLPSQQLVVNPNMTSWDAAAQRPTLTPHQYAYNDPYVNQYPSSTVDSQAWSSYRSSVPDISGSAHMLQHQHTHPQHGQYPSVPPHFKDPSRPRSSPSTFGPSADNIAWPLSSGLGIQYTSTAGQPTPPVTSTFPPAVFQYPIDENYSTSASSPPEIRHPQPRRTYTSIAPVPTMISTTKRPRDDDEGTEASISTKRRKRTSSVASADMSEDDRYLVQLKEDESLPWKDIATRFHTDKGKNFQVAALQMRYKRLREKYRIWEEADVNALKLAHEYWEKYKWEIISAKMPELGIHERWPAKHCARKFQELEAYAAAQPTTTGMAPGISQFSSPVEQPMHFAFLPIQ